MDFWARWRLLVVVEFYRIVEQRVVRASLQTSTPSNPSFGFPKSVRLRTRDEFSRVFDESRNGGRIFRSPLFSIFVSFPNENLRIGLSVAKKRIRKANKRNWLKRSIREFVRMNSSSLNGHMVFRWDGPSSRLEGPDVRAELERFREKFSVWRQSIQ